MGLLRVANAAAPRFIRIIFSSMNVSLPPIVWTPEAAVVCVCLWADGMVGFVAILFLHANDQQTVVELLGSVVH